MNDLDPKYRSNPFKVPDNYFEEVEDSVLNRLKKGPKTKVFFLFSKGFRYSAIAAALSLFLYFNLQKKDTQIEKNTPEITFNNIDSIELENYLANVEISDEDLISVLPTNLVDSIYQEEIVEEQNNLYDEAIIEDIEEEFNLLDNL
jgi:hypothetical protein